MGTIIDSDILLEILSRRYAARSKDAPKHEKKYLKADYSELVEIVSDIGTTEGGRGTCGKPAVFLPLDENTVCCSSCHSQFRASEVRGYNYCPKYGEKIWYTGGLTLCMWWSISVDYVTESGASVFVL